MRLGKHPKKNDRRTLLFARYVNALPAPPSVIDHASKLPHDIGMMGNDKYGDCTVAAAGHQIQSWTIYTGAAMNTIPDQEIMAAYNVLSPTDNGAYMLDVLNYWRKTGIGGDQIEAFVETSTADLTQCKLAIQCFGSHYIGMALPDINTQGPWDVVSPTWKPNPNNGHCVALIGYNDTTKMFKVATWGEVWDMSYDWFQKYVDESYAILNDIEIIKLSGRSPEGFDWTTLQNDLNHIKDQVTPNPIPVPTPVPAPKVTTSMAITKVGSVTWAVYSGSVLQSMHNDQLEAVQNADRYRWAGSKDIVIKHNATYSVT